MAEKRNADIPVTASSGNMFTDLVFAEPKEDLTKAQLASHIQHVIRRQRLTQAAAAQDTRARTCPCAERGAHVEQLHNVARLHAA
jgi:hypothetical protein